MSPPALPPPPPPSPSLPLLPPPPHPFQHTCTPPMYYRIKSILREHSKSGSIAGHMTQNATNQSHCSIPWDQVILACVDHVLNHTSSDLWVACFQGNEKESPVPSEWLRAQAETTLAWATREARNAARRWVWCVQ